MISDMDSLSFDGYTSYSDSSAPRTPSPRADIPYSAPTQIYDDDATNNPAYRGSLLQELYGSQEEEFAKQQQQQQQQQQQHHHHQQQQQQHQPPMPRRATFPYVRHDAPPYPSHYDNYDDPAAAPNSYVVPSNGPSGPTAYYSPPHNPYLQHHPYGPSSGLPPMAMPGMPIPPMAMAGPYGHLPAPLPIQHTDDAASKETQYLRRRCFNCHTTEPPSWRRSTLNPGKIVCNKCGLYERTHLRPRPLRFDELRAGGKARKNSLSNGSGAPASNPKTSPKSPGKNLVKKESVDNGLGRIRPNGRRSSVSSSAGSTSDWDDNAAAQQSQLYANQQQPIRSYSYDSPYDSPTFPPASGYVTSSPPSDSPTFSPHELGAYGASGPAPTSPYHHPNSPYHAGLSPYSHSSASPPDSTQLTHSPQLTLPPIIPEEPIPTKRATN
ncbi:hypothetical protein GYMLUDRAFT_179245 [Collybiopsis luxurians FD-317 M1]|uniref:GATA-type domain-containing protein n=1 Tax=Collybiopsis luxurians FD-317 M1 TaxID=944289 RepID=A0A0D0AS64_9AGAR|nr:hypothetical protein GYMLUDRAFT_179245 [Collybiopsis luxurians FD-317 M1]